MAISLYDRMVSMVAVAILVAAAGFFEKNDGVATAAPTPDVTQKAAPLRLLDVDGKPFDLHQSSKGPVRVVVFTRLRLPDLEPVRTRDSQLVRKSSCQGRGLLFGLRRSG